MKITKRQLRRIITDEKSRLLTESSWRDGDVPDAMPDPMEEFRSRGDIKKFTTKSTIKALKNKYE